MKYKAVIFDLDGTLLNTLEDIADSVNESLKRLGFPQHEVEAYKIFTGDGRDIMAQRALPEEHRDAGTVTKLVKLIDEDYSKCWANKTLPYEGMAELLDGLVARKIKLAVLSNKEHGFTELMVSKLLFRWHFNAVVGLSPGMVKKPDPGAALAIARKFALKPANVAYLGDTDVDMKTAAAAGMFAVGAAWGFRTHAELLDNGAKAIISHPTELLDLL